jgi:hypothetical protein
MSDQKNLDRLFQEKLQNFEQEPRPDVWGQIQDKMQQKKQRRFAFWWLYAAAAIIILGLFILWPEGSGTDSAPMDPIITKTPKSDDQLTDPTKKTTPQIENTFESPGPVKEIQEVITENSVEENIPTKKNRSTRKNSVTQEVIAQNVSKEKKPSQNPELNSERNNTFVAFKEDKQNDQNTLTDLQKSKEKLQEKPVFEIVKKADSLKTNPITQKKKALVAQVDEEIIEETQESKKWSVRPLVVFSTMMNSTSSPAGNSFADNATSGNASLNYGLSVAYEINDKLTLQTGVMTQNVSFNTEDVLLIQQNNVSSASPDLGFREGASYIISGANSLRTVGNSSAAISVADRNAELNQVIRYIEIPVEAKYRLTKSEKIRSYVIGGFSSLFLQNDELILLSDVVGTAGLGSSNNLNTVNFSGNFGLDFDYQINKNLFLNINPMVKVHLNTFAGNSNGYQPYFVGVYSGVKYQF